MWLIVEHPIAVGPSAEPGPPVRFARSIIATRPAVVFGDLSLGAGGGVALYHSRDLERVARSIAMPIGILVVCQARKHGAWENRPTDAQLAPMLPIWDGMPQIDFKADCWSVRSF